MNEKFCSFHMETAFNYANISSAQRLKCGAVLVSSDNTRVLMIGYNGTPSGQDNACENIKCSSCGITINSNYFDDPFCPQCDQPNLHLVTKTNVIHAEENVILFCAKNGIPTQDCIMYTTHSPCTQCAKMIVGAGIKKVYYAQHYRDLSGLELLKNNGVEVEYYEKSY